MAGEFKGSYYRHEMGVSSSAAQRLPYQRGLDPVHDEISWLGEEVRRRGFERAVRIARVKRVFDILFAASALVLLSPVLLVAAAIVKAESPGPVFFTQERIGLNRRRGDRRRSAVLAGMERRRNDRRTSIHAGRPFSILKLRTMRSDAEKDGPALAQENDPRITRAGRFLRKTRIDEIPQFLNVIRGEMSIVGPRPERSFYINRIKQDLPEFPLRLSVKPGITGLAQVENGYTQSLDEMRGKLFFDLKYITGMSLFQELSILLRTVLVVVTGKGAC
ncbi:MAG: sugar transferase [Candidatus Krumholzibacteriota bacterium]|nr:sugar transferase [Candidatus Krumholzibacteriota bacterium]